MSYFSSNDINNWTWVRVPEAFSQSKICKAPKELTANADFHACIDKANDTVSTAFLYNA